MNRSCDLSCWAQVPLMPSWQPSENFVNSCEQEPSTWLPPETFITRTFPCPPVWNLCLFWAAVNSSSFIENNIQLSQTHIETIRVHCQIPRIYECTSSSVAPTDETLTSVTPTDETLTSVTSTDETVTSVTPTDETLTSVTPAIGTVLAGSGCNIVCLTLVLICIVIGLLVIVLLVHRKRSSIRACGELCCSGEVLKRGPVSRSDSCAPTLEGEFDMDKTEDTVSHFCVRYEKDADEVIIGEPSMDSKTQVHVDEAFVRDETIARGYEVPGKENGYAIPAEEKVYDKPMKKNVRAEKEGYDIPVDENGYEILVEEKGYEIPVKQNEHEIPTEGYEQDLEEKGYEITAMENGYGIPAEGKGYRMPVEENESEIPLKEDLHEIEEAKSPANPMTDPFSVC